MKSRTFMIFFISAIVTLIAFPAISQAVTFPITYEGTVHVTASYPYGDCEGDQKMKITLNKNGTLTGTEDFIVSVIFGNPYCKIISDKSMPFQGTYNEAAGKFDAKISSCVEVSGTFDDEKITGHGSGVDGELTLGLSFTLPKVQAISLNPKITLEPATYPEFQMNILEGKGFTVKIRKEDGVMDSQGNSKLNWSTLAFVTDGTDNSMDFVKIISDQWIVKWSISEDGKEVRFDIKPDPKLFMLEQNVFNIKKNGIHNIGLSICDTDDRCGGSNYTIYFGPFIWVEGVTDRRCDDTRISNDLILSFVAFGNIGHPSPKNALYIALQNAVYPDNIWYFYYSFLGVEIWKEGSQLPISPEEIGFATGDLDVFENLLLDLSYSLHYNETKQQEFPAGNYNFYAVLVDTLSGELGGFSTMPVKTCLLFD